MTALFPFTAVVGHDQLKLALKLVLIDPKIGGLLISGGRGSAKSTLARSIASLLESARFVNLPLGAGEEMLTGTLNLSAALGEQKLEFSPGLLARADEGVLYVDEVNLLPDHLVDLLLDAAASGINTVERDGISHQHPARFVLLGTMNPDEGDLRPQLLDRFGLSVTAQTQFNRAERQQIVQHRLAFESDPESFCAEHTPALTELRDTLHAARKHLPDIRIPAELAEFAAELCETSYSEGLRADLTLHRAARAHAALHGRDTCTEADFTAVAELALAHRRQSPPEHPPAASGGAPPDTGNPSNSQTPSRSSGSSGRGRAQAVAMVALPPLNLPPANTAPKLPERIRRSPATRQPGRQHAGYRASPKSGRVDWWRTLISPVWPGEQRVRFARPRPNRAWLTLVLLDTSASTLAHHALARAKSAVLSVAQQTRARRETFALITFGNQQTRLAVRPQRVTGNLGDLAQQIAALPGGGGTPLPDALNHAGQLLRRQRGALDGCSVYLFSDGRVPINHLPAPNFGEWTVVDTEQRRRPLGLARQLAQHLNAHYQPLHALYP